MLVNSAALLALCWYLSLEPRPEHFVYEIHWTKWKGGSRGVN